MSRTTVSTIHKNPVVYMAGASINPLELHRELKSKNIEVTKDQKILTTASSELNQSIPKGEILDITSWLVPASKHYHISPDISDYIIVPVFTIPTGIPNRNGIAFDLKSLIDFDPDTGMQYYKSFKGKPCITGDALISTERGLVRMDKLKDIGCEYVLTRFGESKIQGWQKTGYKPTLTIVTNFGRTLRVTEDHLILVLRKDCRLVWCEAGDLTISDVVISLRGSIKLANDKELMLKAEKVARNAVPKTFQFLSKSGKKFTKVHSRVDTKKFPKTMTKEVARLLGYLSSDGSITKKQIDFCVTSKELMEDFNNCWYKTFGYKLNVKKSVRSPTCNINGKIYNTNTKYSYKVTAARTDILSWFNYLGLGAAISHTKEIPYCILQGSKETKIHYLSAFIEGDGCLSSKKIQISTVSNYLAEQLRLLIESLGFSALTKNPLSKDKGKTIMVIRPREFGSVLKTIRKIRNRRLKDIMKGRDTYPPRYNRIPYVKEWTKFIRKQHATGKRKNRIRGYISSAGEELWLKGFAPTMIDQGDKVTSKYIKAMSKYLAKLNPEYKDRLEHLLIKNSCFEVITKITKSKVVEPVYDIQTEHEEFIANGLVVHNCYVEHKNTDITKARGVIADIFMKKLDGYSQGKVWKIIELLCIDRTKDPELARKVLSKEMNSYSMGAYVKESLCSYCGKEVGKCPHIDPKQPVVFYEKDGHLVHRIMRRVSGFETSAVGSPAWLTASSDFVTEIDTNHPQSVFSDFQVPVDPEGKDQRRLLEGERDRLLFGL